MYHSVLHIVRYIHYANMTGSYCSMNSHLLYYSYFMPLLHILSAFLPALDKRERLAYRMMSGYLTWIQIRLGRHLDLAGSYHHFLNRKVQCLELILNRSVYASVAVWRFFSCCKFLYLLYYLFTYLQCHEQWKKQIVKAYEIIKIAILGSALCYKKQT